MTNLKRKRPTDDRRSAYVFFIGSATSTTYGDVLTGSQPSVSAYTAASDIRPDGYSGVLPESSASDLLMVSKSPKKIIQGGPVEGHTNLCGTPSAQCASATSQRNHKAWTRPARIAALAAAMLAPGLMASTPAVAGIAEKTVAALEALASKGSARAQYELAQHYERADGVKADPRLALSLYCRAARQDYADAALMAGRMHMAGLGGVSKDADLGRAWLRKAAALGSEPAERLVGSASGMVKTPDRCEPPNLRWGIIRKPPAEIRAMVQKMAPTYGLDPDLVLSVIAVESGYRIDVVSNKNAQGLMQLIPETAERFGVSDPFNAEQNLRGGMKYLRWLLAYFDGNVAYALAGYNAGEGAVLQYKGIPPYRETQDYVTKIRGIYAPTYHPFNRNVVQSAGLVSTAREEVAELSLSTRTRSSGKR
nr:transglycosylase SLT domain-containing protein [Azospirillum sp. 412522]